MKAYVITCMLDLATNPNACPVPFLIHWNEDQGKDAMVSLAVTAKRENTGYTFGMVECEVAGSSMEPEVEIRKMRAIVNAFGHPEAKKALDWVLKEYSAEHPEPASAPADIESAPGELSARACQDCFGTGNKPI